MELDNKLKELKKVENELARISSLILFCRINLLAIAGEKNMKIVRTPRIEHEREDDVKEI